ncbi:MAG: response regulator [Paracoccaceae bacterium]
MRFLAVDDDPAFLEIVRDFIGGEERHELQTATSATEALDMVQASPQAYDAFLLDIQMPGMSGVELCGAIRGIDSLQNAPIVMLTAAAERHFIDGAFANGATDYMHKPLDPLEWKSRIKMIERLHEERQRTIALARQAWSANREYHEPVDFETRVSLFGQDNVIEYLALENYLLTLDRRGLFAHAAVGIHVENAPQIYSKASAAAFVEAMRDAAAAICDALKAHSFMFAYAGAGDFVAVTPRQAPVDTQALEAEINGALSEFDGLYKASGLPTPRVQVGEQERSSLFGKRRANVILQQAIWKARQAEQPGISEESHLSQIRDALKR